MKPIIKKKAPPRPAQAPEDLGLDFSAYPVRPAVAPEDKPIKGNEKSWRKSLEIHLIEWFNTAKEYAEGKEIPVPRLYNTKTLADTIIEKLEGKDNPIFYDPKAKIGSILRRGFWHITKAYELTPDQTKWLRSVRINRQSVNPSSLLSYFFPIDAPKHAKSPIANKQDFAQAVKNGMKRVGVWTVERAVREWAIGDLASFERAQAEPVQPDYGWADEEHYDHVGEWGSTLFLRGPSQITNENQQTVEAEPAWWDDTRDVEDETQDVEPPPPVLDGGQREALRGASVAFENYGPVGIVFFDVIQRALGGMAPVQTWADFDSALQGMHDAQRWFDFDYNAYKIIKTIDWLIGLLESLENQGDLFEDAALEGKNLVVEFVFNKVVSGFFGIEKKGENDVGMVVISIGSGSTAGMTSWPSHSISFTASDVYYFESDLFRYTTKKIRHVADVDYGFFVDSILKIIIDAKDWMKTIKNVIREVSPEPAKNVCLEGESLYVFSDGTRLDASLYNDDWGAVRQAALMTEARASKQMREVLGREVLPPCGPNFQRNPPARLYSDKPKPTAAPKAPKVAPAVKTASQELEELAEMVGGAEGAKMRATARAMREVEEIARLAAEARALGLGSFANTMDDLAALLGD